MVFEPNFTRIVSSVRKNIGITQSIVELKLPTNDNSEISEIFSVGANSTIVSSETAGNEVSFVGLIDFQAVYNADGISAIDYSAEFKDKFVYTEELNGELILTSNVIDVNSSIVGNGVKVVAIVETAIDQIVSKDLNVLTHVNSEGSFMSTKEIEYATYLGKASEKLEVGGDIEIKGATKILMFSPCVTLSEVEAKDNYIAISGVLDADVCYQTGENINDIMSNNYSVNFNWEVALDGVDANSSVHSLVSLISNEIKISTSLEEGRAIVNMFVPVIYTGYVFTKNKINVIDDIYLEKNYLAITSENFDTLDTKVSIPFKDNVSGTASISDTSPFIDEVLGVCTNNIVLASSRVEDCVLTIEGIANVTVMYYTKETNSNTSVQVEMPFSIDQKIDGNNASIVSLCLSDVSARSKRGKEIEVSAGLNIFVDTYDILSVGVITDITLGNEKPEEDCSLFIYIVKPNQTLWQIAKEMSVSDSVILEQNPEVELPLRAGDKLVIYKPRVVEY